MFEHFERGYRGRGSEENHLDILQVDEPCQGREVRVEIGARGDGRLQGKNEAPNNERRGDEKVHYHIRPIPPASRPFPEVYSKSLFPAYFHQLRPDVSEEHKQQSRREPCIPIPCRHFRVRKRDEVRIQRNATGGTKGQV